MARSPHWPHPTYLDTYIVFTLLITGCNAAEDNGGLVGIIAGSIVAFILLIIGVVGIVYCVMRSKRSRKAKKQQIHQVNNNMDYRTVVVRRMPTVSVHHPTIVGYPEVMVEYHRSVPGHLRSKVPTGSTISHMPVQRPALVPMGYYTSHPRKLQQSSRERCIEDRKSNRQSRSRSNPPVANSISNHKILDISRDSWAEHESQFILRKKEGKHNPIANSQSKPNEPYALTSLFSRNRETSQRPESRYYVSTEDNTQKEETETYEPVGLQRAYSQQPSPTQTQQLSSPASYPARYSARSNSPERDDFEAERPVTPDYDAGSIADGDGANPDISFTDGNRFSYAAAAELQQSSRFRNGTEDHTADLFGYNSKQVQFNPLSFDEANPPIETSRLNPGSYGNIPPPPPLPPS